MLSTRSCLICITRLPGLSNGTYPRNIVPVITWPIAKNKVKGAYGAGLEVDDKYVEAIEQYSSY